MSTSSALPAIVVLVSGEGTNLQALMDSSREGRLAARIAAVISDRASAPGLDRARRAAIEAISLAPSRYSSRAAYESALADAIDAHSPAAVVLAGFMRVLGADLVSRFQGRMLNIHPSLLPRHRGLDTHRRGREAGDREHGATVVFVTGELDAGPRVIQYRLPVSAHDSAETLAARVHRGEHIILPQAVGWLAGGRLALTGDQVRLDGERLAGPVVIEEK